VLCVPAQTSLTLTLTTGLDFTSGQNVVLANQGAKRSTSGGASGLRGLISRRRCPAPSAASSPARGGRADLTTCRRSDRAQASGEMELTGACTSRAPRADAQRPRYHRAARLRNDHDP
jgi:hypothetical protein